VERFESRNKLKVSGERGGRHLSVTPFGRQTIQLFMQPLVEHFAKIDDLDPPGSLAETLRKVPPQELAQVVLVPLLHRTLTEQDRGQDGKRELSAAVGQYLHTLLLRRDLLAKAAADKPEPIQLGDRAYAPAAVAKMLTKPPAKRRRRKKGEPPARRGRPRNSDARQLWREDWEPVDFVQAGWWLVQQALAMPYFQLDTSRRGMPHMPVITPEWMERILAIRRELIALDRDQLPSFDPIPPWTVPVRDGVAFVSSFHSDTRRALKSAFADYQTVYDLDDTELALSVEAATRPETAASRAAQAALLAHKSTAKPQTIPGLFLREHVAGVNYLESVVFKLDPVMVELADELALNVLDRQGWQRRQDDKLLRTDIDFAQVIGDRSFRMKHCCDWRGRVYQVPLLNFQRADHIRAMFRFAKGKKLGNRRVGHKLDARIDRGEARGYSDLEMLEIHCANCHGEDKLPWDGRLQWIAGKREMIERIGNDPRRTFDEWRGVDSPFCFVAACCELVSAWNDPEFESCLPIAFDGTANGLQHLSALVRDREAVERVNLIGDKRSDIYGLVAKELGNVLEASAHEHATFWRSIWGNLDDRDRRKLVKQPAMTFPYGVERGGAVRQLAEEFNRLLRHNAEPEEGAFGFLVDRVFEAVARVLPGAAKCRTYLRSLAERRLERGGFLDWVSATGFPVFNTYREPDIVTVRTADGGEMEVANSEADAPRAEKAIRSAAPNFVHSQDAAHLIRVALAARDAGIENLVTIHDCFACLAADAAVVNHNIRFEFFKLYSEAEWLMRLCERNGLTDMPPLAGDVDPENYIGGEYSWS
jgi:hypothetical protein